MTRMLGVILCVIALVATGFFLNKAGQILGILETPAASAPAGGKPGMPGTGGGAYPGAEMGADASAVPVEVATATVRTVRERVSGSGILEPAREVMILARVEGAVEEMFVEEGDTVETNAALCAIDEGPLRLAESIAKIERDQTARVHDRLADLIDSRSISPQELEEARSSMERAAANYSQASLDLAHARPLAPFSGTIVDRAIELGQSVRPGDALFTIADFEPLRLRLHLPESTVTPILVGQVAELRSDRDGEVITRGRVERISPVVDRASLTVEVVCQFEFAAGTIRPGSFGHVDIITHTEENVVLVPRRAVLRTLGEAFVFRIADGRAHRTVVLTGYEDESWVQVREGIAAGDRVATEGVRELKDGASVDIYRDVPAQLEAVTVGSPGSGQG